MCTKRIFKSGNLSPASTSVAIEGINMKKAASDDEVSLALDEIMMLTEALHKGASSMAEAAAEMIRHGGTSNTIPISHVKSMLKETLDLSINRFLEEFREVRGAEVKRPAASKKVVKKKTNKK